MFQFLEVYIVLSGTYTFRIKADIKLETNRKKKKANKKTWPIYHHQYVYLYSMTFSMNSKLQDQ